MGVPMSLPPAPVRPECEAPGRKNSLDVCVYRPRPNPEGSSHRSLVVDFEAMRLCKPLQSIKAVRDRPSRGRIPWHLQFPFRWCRPMGWRARQRFRSRLDAPIPPQARFKQLLPTIEAVDAVLVSEPYRWGIVLQSVTCIFRTRDRFGDVKWDLASVIPVKRIAATTELDHHQAAEPHDERVVRTVRIPELHRKTAHPVSQLNQVARLGRTCICPESKMNLGNRVDIPLPELQPAAVSAPIIREQGDKAVDEHELPPLAPHGLR